MKNVKGMVKKTFARFGFQLSRLTPASNAAYQLRRGLDRFDVNVVFDIGANTGQFARGLRGVGYQGKLVSFEPLSNAHAGLVEHAARDRQWIVHECVAIGGEHNQIEINVAGNSVSSSVLPMLEAHSSASVDSAYVASEPVELRTLDSVAPGYIDADSRCFVKIDAQGLEWEVLDGASETLKETIGAQIELSLVPLYDGQRLWREIIERMEDEGFTLWALQRGFTDPRDGRTLQMDAIFFRLGEDLENE